MLNLRVFSLILKNKTRFYAGNLVPLGPLSTIGVGGTDA